MSNDVNELQIYKIAAAMSGEMLFCYDIAEDEMSFYYGIATTNKFGSGIRNFIGYFDRNYCDHGQNKEARDIILSIVKTGTPGFFETEMTLKTQAGTLQDCIVSGRCLYDDNNDPDYLVGKIVEKKATKAGGFQMSEKGIHRDALTGAMDRSSFRNKLTEIVNAGEDVIRGYLLFSIDDLRDNCDNITSLENNVLISVVQTTERIFPYNVIIGRVRYDEIGVFYTGNDIENEFLSKVDQLDRSVRLIQIEGLKRPITISGGVYFENMKDVNAYDVRDRARVAQIAANSRGKGRIIPYRKELENVYNSDFNLEAEYSNTSFDYNLVEQAMDIMTASRDAEESINELLRKIGLMYNLDRITVRNMDDENLTLPVLARWVDVHSDTSVTVPTIVNYELAKKLHDSDEEIYVDDAHGAVICRYVGTFGDKGVVDFKTRERGRHWSEREIRTFKLLTKLTSAYLLNMRAYMKLVQEGEEAKTHDAITGFVKFERFIAEATEYVQSHPEKNLAILYTGMKDLLGVNSQYGHEVGDTVLKAYADELTQTEDRMVMGCRRNADNFVALVNCFDNRGNPISAAMIERMSRSFQNKVEPICQGVDLAINAGVVFLPKEVTDLREYVDRALIARDQARADDNISCILA